MSSRDLAISVRGLSKSYKISHNAVRHTTAAEAIVDTLKGAGRRQEMETFWALRDVDFDIRQGEVIGVIGRNGAGKSTLLKILSRITEPTAGEIDIYGRIGSLLEVGTGFHPELTGRENVFLNGAILGMNKREIARQFDAIVDFAGVEQFLDTPVKRYSSGMYVRLAFAVAAHLDPEILIVDEVLAVGDAEFQKKCLGKMRDVASAGRTILFVSHNMASLKNLCSRALLFEGGRLTRSGDIGDMVRYYVEHVMASVIQDTPLSDRTDRTGTGKIRLTDFHVEDTEGRWLPGVVSGMDTVFVFGYQCREKVSNVDVGCSIHTSTSDTLFALYSSYVGETFDPASAQGEFRCLIPDLPLPAGRYSVGARVTVAGEEADWPRDGVGFLNVESGDFYGTGSLGVGNNTPFLVRGDWSMQASK